MERSFEDRGAESVKIMYSQPHTENLLHADQGRYLEIAQSLLSQLKPKRRMAFVLREIEGREYSEVAAEFLEFRKPRHGFVFGGRGTILIGNFGNIWKKGAEMKKLCDLFNQYRDGMLDSEQKRQVRITLGSV